VNALFNLTSLNWLNLYANNSIYCSDLDLLEATIRHGNDDFNICRPVNCG
jgi:hypothetical protein